MAQTVSYKKRSVTATVNKKKVAKPKTVKAKPNKVTFTKAKAIEYFKKVAKKLGKTEKDVMTEPQFYLTMAIDLREMSVKEAQELLEYMKKNNIVQYHARYIRLKRNEKNVAKKKIVTADGRELLTKLPTKKTPIKKVNTSLIRPWYHSAYPTDPIWTDISPTVTFDAVWNLLKKGMGHNFYDFTGAHDSVVRERIFEELSKRKKVSYGRIYDMWLGV